VRAPHHTISYAAMVGGGPRLSPGEITLADQGVLFLDELPEFARDVLEALRQPLEEGRVAIARVGRATVFPARFQLVAAMNPCPCGYAGTAERACACPVALPERYQRRISGPLRDRIDVWVSMPRVAPLSLVGGPEPEDSTTVASRIAVVRQIAAERGAAAGNGRLTGRSLRAACRLSVGAERRVVLLADLERASGRGTERLLRVARTIADLAGDDAVREEHLDEAAWFRPADLRLAAAEAG
jgi:magnesium chelatase family protein